MGVTDLSIDPLPYECLKLPIVRVLLIPSFPGPAQGNVLLVHALGEGAEHVTFERLQIRKETSYGFRTTTLQRRSDYHYHVGIGRLGIDECSSDDEE